MAGIGESIMNMFKTQTPATAAPAQQQTTPGQIPPGSGTTPNPTNGTAPNGVVPATATTNADGTPITPTPFADYKDLWEPVKTDPNNPAPDASVFGKIDPQKFMEAAGKIDFKKVVTPEMMTAIQAGGEAGTAAFAEAMNKVAQSTYAQSAFATTKIVEQAIEKSRESFLKDLPNQIKRQTVTDSLRTENPIFSNPAVQPLISAMEAQFTVKYPHATAPEITQLAKNYIAEIGSSFAPKPVEKKSAKAAKGETDWSTFLPQEYQ